VSDVADILTPRRFVPRPQALERVLHVGDSMTFGFGVDRDRAFPSVLARLEPGTEHINAAFQTPRPMHIF
jgi:hypothetical protein